MAVVCTSLERFDEDVIAASDSLPVLVDFWAEWCAPCLVIAPILEQLAGEFQGRLRIAKLEVDQGENMKLAGRYRLRGFPTVILFYRRGERGRFSGARSKAAIVEFLRKQLDDGDST